MRVRVKTWRPLGKGDGCQCSERPEGFRAASVRQPVSCHYAWAMATQVLVIARMGENIVSLVDKMSMSFTVI